MALFNEEVVKFLLSDAGTLLRADVLRWALWRGHDASSDEALLQTFERLFANHPEFRSVLDYRARHAGRDRDLDLLRRYNRTNDLYIYCPDIGPGLLIQHGHSTWLMAEKVGRNFLINQNVTVGVDKGGKPSIGDDVQIRTGAVVSGPIRIGNNVTVAPNAFVNFDVPDNSTVFPARSVVVQKKKASPPTST